MTGEQAKAFCEGFGISKLEHFMNLLEEEPDWKAVGKSVSAFVDNTLAARKDADTLVQLLSATIMMLVRAVPRNKEHVPEAVLDTIERVARGAAREDTDCYSCTQLSCPNHPGVVH